MGKAAQAIVLRRIAYGEADWIVTFLDREHGRMSGIARSARSSMRVRQRRKRSRAGSRPSPWTASA